ncbi:MAG: Uma2 family endonuclease [Eubacterium sp.]|nr:Uma2 family endonuclease [Eubacterium sp.]
MQALERVLAPHNKTRSGVYRYPTDSLNQDDQSHRNLQNIPGAGSVKESSSYSTAREWDLEAGIEQGEHTLDDYLSLPDDQRVELIDGVFYKMNAPSTSHQLIAGNVYAAFLAYTKRKKGPCLPFISPVDVQLDCDDRTIVQPDVLILCDRSKLVYPRIFGAPDFVLEILSKSTRSKDMYLKLVKYKGAGVREYWMADPQKKRIVTYDLETDDAIHLYSFRDKVSVQIWGGECQVDFAPIDDLLTELGLEEPK